MLKHRIPEGTAIVNEPEFTTDEYSSYMYKKRRRDYHKYVENLLKQILLPKHANVLEIGPGPGWIPFFLKEKRPDLYIDALELSLDMINTATKNVRKINGNADLIFIQGNVEEMTSLKTNHYDLVYSNDSMHHWENLENAFKEINRVLKPKGKLYIHDSKRNLGVFGKFILHVLGRFFAGKMWKYWKSSIDASYTQSELQEIISKLRLAWKIEEDVMDLLITKKN